MSVTKPSASVLVNLKYLNARAEFDVRAGTAVQVSAQLVSGAWSGAGSAKVRKYIGIAGPFDFASAKTLPAATPSCAIASAEMEGVTRIVVDWALQEASDSYVQVCCDQEVPS